MFYPENLILEIDGLKRFAYQLTGNEPDAEDLLQTTLLRALENKNLFQTGSHLFKWTSKIMYNQFVSQCRRRTRFESQYDPEPYIERLRIAPPQEKQIELFEVGQALTSLSKKHRQILFMICIAGMKYKTVAKKLGIPVGTVRSRLYRAREQLKIHLKKKPIIGF